MKFVLTSLILICLVNSVIAQSRVDDIALSDTPSAVAFAEFVSVLRDVDETRVARWINESWHQDTINQIGIDAIKRSVVAWRNAHQNAEFVEERVAKPQQYVAVFKDSVTEQFFGFILDLEKGEGHRIINARIVPARPPLSAARQEITGNEAQTQVNKLLDRLSAADRFSGVVLIARKDQPIVQKAVGRVSRRYSQQNDLDTTFCLGSMTKMFTALAIAQMVDQDRIDLDDPVSKYLGEPWISPAAGRRIQIKHLLSHSGGTGDFLSHPAYFEISHSKLRDVDDYAQFIEIENPEFEPGSKFSYSNTGFVLLGKIVENISGQDYFTYMRKHFYDPLELHRTGCFDWDEPQKNIAEGFFAMHHRQRGLVWKSNVFMMRARGCPAGASYSSAKELLRFSWALQQGKVIKKSTLDEFWSAKPEFGSDDYGYGFQVFQRDRWATGLGHSGGAPGVRAHFLVYPEHEITLIVLSNYGDAHEAVYEKCRLLVTQLIGGWKGK